MKTYTKKELIKDVEFLVKRAAKAESMTGFSRRGSGMSSNSIVVIAYGLLENQYLPSDTSDLAACERMWLKLPAHRKTPKVIEAMGKARGCNYYGKDKNPPEKIQEFVNNEVKDDTANNRQD